MRRCIRTSNTVPMLFTLSLLLSLCYLIGFTSGAIITERISIIVSRNASQNIKNKLVCQQFTDIQPQQPLLFAADHFSLPNLTSNSTINTFQLSFSIVRLRYDADPDSITVVLMYDEPLTESPGKAFFTKSVRAPNNPPQWHNKSVGTVEVISLNITQGETSSTDSEVVFDIGNTTFLPRETRLWLGFYVSGERHFLQATPMPLENVLFWCTTDEAAPPGETTPYFFRDQSDMLSMGFKNWTNATVVEERFALNSGEKHMAWSLTLLAVMPVTPWERLQQVPLKELITIIVSSIVGLAITCLCICCICKRCKRARMRGLAPVKDNTVPSYALYDPLESAANNSTYTTTTTNSQIELSELSASASTLDTIPFTRNSPSGNTPSSKYNKQNSFIPIVMSGEDNFDKNK